MIGEKWLPLVVGSMDERKRDITICEMDEGEAYGDFVDQAVKRIRILCYVGNKRYFRFLGENLQGT